MAHVREVTRKFGTAYEVRWREGGTFKQKSFTVKRDAERHALRIESTKAAGGSTEPLVGRSKIFRQVAEEMLAAERPRLKQSTVDGYEIPFRVHVFPVLGNARIAAVTANDIQGFLADLRAKPKANGMPRSETSVRGTYKAVAKVFTYAYKHRLISFNPCIAVAKPNADTSEARFLSVEEVSNLAAELDMQPPYDLLVRFAAFTGLRAGEVAALQIKHIDLLHAEVQVRQNTTHTSAGYVTGSPKSKRSVRDVPILDDQLYADLAAYLERHPYRSDPEALLWPGKVPGHNTLSYAHRFDYKGFYRYTFKPATQRAGMTGLHFHELRHTFATVALESGALDMFELSRAMGHESYEITDRTYAHLRKKDYSAHRARFSAHVAAGGAATPLLLRARAGD